MVKATISCLGSDCPERFSLCCHAHSRSASEPEKMLGVPHFFCSKCGKEFMGGKCRAEVKMERLAKMLHDGYDWEKEFDKENWHAMAGKNGICACGDKRGDCNTSLKAFIRDAVELAEMKLLETLGGKLP